MKIYNPPVIPTSVITYSYVVGPTGNYPGTPTGLQAAITAAGSSPIFIQPGFSGSSPSVTLGQNTKLIGSVNENPAGTLFYQNGVPNFDQSTQNNVTVINCTLILPAGGVNILFENICYVPSGALFTCTLTDNALYNLTFNNCKALTSFANAFNITVSGSTFATFAINANNSSFNGDTCSLCVLTNNGPISGSTLTFNTNLSNGSAIGFSEQSTVTGWGISYFVNVSDSFHAAPIKWVSGDVCSVYLSFSNCIIADMGNGHSVLEGALYNLYLQQLQDVTFCYNTDFSASPVSIINNAPTNLVSNYGYQPQQLAFTNCIWSANSTVNSAFQVITAPYLTAQDQAINAVLGKFNNTNIGGGQIIFTRVVIAAGAVTVTAADYMVIVNKTSGAATTVNLPAGVLNTIFIIKDGKGDAAANNITVTPAAGNIDGASTYVMNTNYAAIGLVYNGTQWNIF